MPQTKSIFQKAKPLYEAKPILEKKSNPSHFKQIKGGDKHSAPQNNNFEKDQLKHYIHEFLHGGIDDLTLPNLHDESINQSLENAFK